MPEGTVQGPTNADRAFLDEMAAVLETARLSAAEAIQRASRPEIKVLARQIHDEHARRVSALRSLRQTWFGDDVHVLTPTPRSISAGPTFEREWLLYMAELHQRAIDVAAERLKERGDPQGDGLARQLHASETREQEELRTTAAKY